MIFFLAQVYLNYKENDTILAILTPIENVRGYQNKLRRLFRVKIDFKSITEFIKLNLFNFVNL